MCATNERMSEIPVTLLLAAIVLRGMQPTSPYFVCFYNNSLTKLNRVLRNTKYESTCTPPRVLEA